MLNSNLDEVACEKGNRRPSHITNKIAFRLQINKRTIKVHIALMLNRIATFLNHMEETIKVLNKIL